MSGAAVRFWCGALIALYATLFAVLWARGPVLQLGDFSILWAAGHLAAAGDAAAAYDWTAIKQLQPFAVRVQAFFYPPTFLLVLAPLGLLPYLPAAAIWVVATLCAYLAAMRAILPGGTALLAALAAPPVLFNLGSGQNGLLLAALLGGALALLDSRPLTAGVLIGLSAYKPHFGVLLPLFLAITGRWRVFGWAALTVLGLGLFAGALFGWSAWAAFFEAIRAANDAFLQQGRLADRFDWSALASHYGMLHTLDFGTTAAWRAHMLVAAAAAAAALWLAAGRAPDAVKFAALLTAALTIPPYSEPSDLAILGPAFAFLVRDGLANGWPRWQQRVLAGAFLLPLLDFVARMMLKGAGHADYSWLAGPAVCALLALVIAARAVALRHSGRDAAAAR
jgi:alpha-1,2-mannosyltransferase